MLTNLLRPFPDTRLKHLSKHNSMETHWEQIPKQGAVSCHCWIILMQVFTEVKCLL